MKKIGLLFLVVIGLAFASKSNAQNVLTTKKMVVPSWLNVAVAGSNQLEGGHHVFANWSEYTSSETVDRVQLGMMMTILDPKGDASQPAAFYVLKAWATQTAIPLQAEWTEISEYDGVAAVYYGSSATAIADEATVTANLSLAASLGSGLYGSIPSTTSAVNEAYHLLLPVSWRNPELFLGSDVATSLLTLNGQITISGVTYNHWETDVFPATSGISGNFTVK